MPRCAGGGQRAKCGCLISPSTLCSGDQIHATWLGSEYLYPMSHLVGPPMLFLIYLITNNSEGFMHVDLL